MCECIYLMYVYIYISSMYESVFFLLIHVSMYPWVEHTRIGHRIHTHTHVFILYVFIICQISYEMQKPARLYIP